jgi:hypothetical protein
MPKRARLLLIRQCRAAAATPPLIASATRHAAAPPPRHATRQRSAVLFPAIASAAAPLPPYALMRCFFCRFFAFSIFDYISFTLSTPLRYYDFLRLACASITIFIDSYFTLLLRFRHFTVFSH